MTLPTMQASWLRFASALSMLFGSFACQPASSTDGDDATGALSAAVVNGEDDRRELFQLERGDDREILAGSVAALMWAHRIDYAEPTLLRAISARDALNLCEEERFADQPAAAICSATLIDDDLVLTAGHCLGDRVEEAAEHCRRLLVVFGYHYSSPGRLALASAENVYACRRVAYHDIRTDQDFSDIAILQLDRKVSSIRQPVAIGADFPRGGESLVAAAHGAGLPLKVDLGGTVIDVAPDADYLVASTDSFEGGSGAPLFNETMTLVGHQVRGVRDWQPDGGCFRARRVDEPNEQHQLARRAVQAFCDSGWPSEPLCGRAPECGDGVCSGSETSTRCRQDCPAPRCGDDLCEPSERAGCTGDCSAYLEVPADWLPDPATFHRPEPRAADQVIASGGCNVAGEGARRPEPSFAWLALLARVALRRQSRKRSR